MSKYSRKRAVAGRLCPCAVGVSYTNHRSSLSSRQIRARSRPVRSSDEQLRLALWIYFAEASYSTGSSLIVLTRKPLHVTLLTVYVPIRGAHKKSPLQNGISGECLSTSCNTSCLGEFRSTFCLFFVLFVFFGVGVISQRPIANHFFRRGF